MTMQRTRRLGEAHRKVVSLVGPAHRICSIRREIQHQEKSDRALENVGASCMGSEACCMAVSAPLQIATGRWGDVETPYSPPSATVQPDVGDIGVLVNKFRNTPGALIKARILIAGDDAFGNITTLNVDLGFGHISACVDAFRGKPYPYTISSCP